MREQALRSSGNLALTSRMSVGLEISPFQIVVNTYKRRIDK
jgi:hypothetical protein